MLETELYRIKTSIIVTIIMILLFFVTVILSLGKKDASNFLSSFD